MFFPGRRPLTRATMLGGRAQFFEARRLDQLERRDATAPPAPAPGADVIGQLTKLKDLLDSGAVTQDEFEAAKRKLLAS